MRQQMMKCAHGRTRQCPQCTPPKVTVTGRAVSPGRVTRASNLVRTRAKGESGKPLPLDMQCHPKALSRTSRNPGCIKSLTPQYGACLNIGVIDIIRPEGVGLSTTGRFSVIRVHDLKELGRTDNVALALGYRLRADKLNIKVEVIDNE